MTFLQRYLARVAKVEELTKSIDDWETWAKDQVNDEHPEINDLEDITARANTRAMYRNKLLEMQHRYKNLIGARNQNMNMAMMYGFGALLEMIDEDEPAARHEDPAGRGDGHQPGPTVRSQHRDQAA